MDLWELLGLLGVLALVPALGGKNAFGFGISLLAALAASATGVIAMSRFSLETPVGG